MKILIDFVIIVLLSLIIYQDFKQRAIYWFLPPLLCIFLVIRSLLFMPYYELFNSFLFNAGFIVLQLLLLSVWMSIKNKRFVNIVDSYLGLGDILFFFAIAAAFSPFQFVLFYVAGIFFTLLMAIVSRLKSTMNPQIPLAGAMSIFMIFCLILSVLKPEFSFYGTILFLH